jgi:DNA-binding NarL/FixJ family response regulator
MFGGVMPKSIMIVDDNEIIRRTLRNLFKKNKDWNVCAESADGYDAVEKAEKFRPDFVVLDHSMPNIDGLEIAPKLKDISPNSSIVMLTAFKDRFLEERAYRAGISWVLSKTTDDVHRVIDFARILLRPDSHLESTGTQYQEKTSKSAINPSLV